MTLGGSWKQRGGWAKSQGAAGHQPLLLLAAHARPSCPGQRSTGNSGEKAEGVFISSSHLSPTQPGRGLDEGVSANGKGQIFKNNDCTHNCTVQWYQIRPQRCANTTTNYS